MQYLNRDCWNAALAIIAAVALGACGGSNESGEDGALADLQKKYDELVDDKLDAPVQWASEDLKRIGDWEYKVVELDRLNAAELETALNELGAERWEVVWVEKTLRGQSIILKRPAISYLSKIPLSQLGRFIGGDGEPTQ